MINNWNLNLKFFTGEENEGSYYKFPKVLIEDEKFNKLSLKAKILYTLLLDRVKLSTKNNWKINGKIYVYYTLDEVARNMRISVRSAGSLFKELENGFIETAHQGLGKPNIIYVKNLSSFSQNDSQKEAKKDSKKDSKKDGKYKYAKAHISAKEVQKDKEISALKKRVNELEMQLKMQEKDTSIECKNCHSRPAKIATLDQQKLQGIKNNINKNNINIIDSSNQSKSDFSNKKFENKNREKNDLKELNYNKFNIKKITEKVKSDLEITQTLPYEYTTNSVKMEIALKELTCYEKNKELSNGDTFYFNALKIFINAATRMLTTEQTLILKGVTVTHYKFYMKFIECIELNYKGELELNNIVNNSIRDYEKAVESTQIFHPVNYMCSCIWNAISYENIKEWDDIKRKN